MNRVEEMTEREAKDLLNEIFAIFHIGASVRSGGVLVANINNCKRFAEYLHAVEKEFFMVPCAPNEDCLDEELEDVCLVNSWGSNEDEYLEQFRSALEKI